VAADVNGDGRPDLVVSNFSAGNVVILLRNAGVGFASPIFGANALDNASAVAVADFNGDGRLDLAVARWNLGNILVFLRQPDGSYAQEGGTVGTGTNPRSFAVGDFNGDGRPDLAVTNSGSANVTILLRNAGSGFTSAGAPVTVGTNPFGVVAVDFNGDAKVDLAVANSGSDTVTILNGNGSGGFAPAGPEISVGDGPVGVALGDFNRDGFADLALSNANSGNVSILLGNGSSGFTPLVNTPITTGAGAVGVAVGLFGPGGAPDLAVANNNAGADPDTLSVLLGDCPLADLAVSVSDAPDPAAANADITYSITVQNIGPDAATSVSLSNLLPTGGTFVSLTSPGGWTCATPAVGTTGTVTCTIASLPVGTAQFALVARSVGAGTLTDSVTVAAVTADQVGGNNTASTTTVVLGPCSRRPNVSLQVVKDGAGRLRVAVAAAVDSFTPTNQLTQLTATIPANALVDVVGGPSDLAGQQTLPIGNGTQPVIFVVRRVGAGAVTMPLRVTDACGEFRTFVGGGEAAF
jgi:uncharacterized repeat protein (TIGR01451 family)